jgi:hypothetical protein
MFTVTTTYHKNSNGAGRITAKGKGKQRTVTYDHSKSADSNHGLAAAALLNALLTPMEAAVHRHPSAQDRIAHTGLGNGVHKFIVHDVKVGG